MPETRLVDDSGQHPSARPPHRRNSPNAAYAHRVRDVARVQITLHERDSPRVGWIVRTPRRAPVVLARSTRKGGGVDGDWRRRLVDKVMVYIAPVIIESSPAAGIDFTEVSGQLYHVTSHKFDQDVLIEGLLQEDA